MRGITGTGLDLLKLEMMPRTGNSVPDGTSRAASLPACVELALAGLPPARGYTASLNESSTVDFNQGPTQTFCEKRPRAVAKAQTRKTILQCHRGWRHPRSRQQSHESNSAEVSSPCINLFPFEIPAPSVPHSSQFRCVPRVRDNIGDGDSRLGILVKHLLKQVAAVGRERRSELRLVVADHLENCDQVPAHEGALAVEIDVE
jgi:hypothetical protein